MTKGIRLGLACIKSLLTSLGDPHLAVPIIHVAGTNGKGSVCAYLDSILRASGLRVGRFTSPHLTQVRDCITLLGKTIEEQAYKEIRDHVQDTSKSKQINASSFELLTATAFEAFRRVDPPLDLAIVEVGVGGETDATNVCPRPVVTVITAIDLDHQALLGDTVPKIARIKAGIMKKGVSCILAPQAYQEANAVVSIVAQQLDAPLYQAQAAEMVDPSLQLASFHMGDGTVQARLPLVGAYQCGNAATAVQAVDVLRKSGRLAGAAKITSQTIKQGLEATKWPGRLDWITLNGRRALLDGAHNVASIKALRNYLDGLPPRPITFVLALSAPRRAIALLQPLFQGMTGPVEVIAVEFSKPEGMPWVKPIMPAEIVEAAGTMQVHARAASSLDEAIGMVGDDDVVVFCGSLYLIADVYRLLEHESDG